MAKPRLIVLLILFLPYVSYSMESNTNSCGNSSKLDKMAIKFLVHEHDINPDLSDIDQFLPEHQTASEYVKESKRPYDTETQKIKELISLLPRQQNKYTCRFCLRRSEGYRKYDGIRNHLLAAHVKPFYCVTCNARLSISHRSQASARNIPLCDPKNRQSRHTVQKRDTREIIARIDELIHKLQPSTT